MKKVLQVICIMILAFSCKGKGEKEIEKTSEDLKEVSAEETKQDEWTVLFDGTSFDGWHVYPDKEVPETWQLEDGAMILRPTGVRKDGERFNLVTDKEFTSFELSLEWKVSEGANSGIMWGVQDNLEYQEPYYTGPEIQVLDNISHPDAKNGTTHRAGSLYDMVAPSKDVVKPVGSWNTYVITINHNTNEGSVVLNGEKIVTFPVNGQEWEEMVAKSKFADWEAFGKFKTGKIALQDHGEKISIGYRNIKIREL
ncbi:MAG: DUF1080 domain-containing protein [Bacteroidota bacterium]